MPKPIPRLCADLKFGEGEVRFPEDWEDIDWVMRADLLHDWICELTEKYNVTLITEVTRGHS